MYSNCISCGKEFSSTAKKKVSKKSIYAKLQNIDKTVKNVFEDEFGVTLTPQAKENRFLCQPCTWTVVSFSKSRDASRSALDKLKETANWEACCLKNMRVQPPLKVIYMCII